MIMKMVMKATWRESLLGCFCSGFSLFLTQCSAGRFEPSSSSFPPPLHLLWGQRSHSGAQTTKTSYAAASGGSGWLCAVHRSVTWAARCAGWGRRIEGNSGQESWGTRGWMLWCQVKIGPDCQWGQETEWEPTAKHRPHLMTSNTQRGQKNHKQIKRWI